MRLKRLEIYGFKTFPDKSVIDFPAGISAVVGPNGCGKSNIFDAIKWVMGEQSIKQLRGKSMGDVIFAGTEKRAPVNIAEVSLLLANDGGRDAAHLPPYSEVQITRRLYRSGESAYLLNKQPCRLKDIHNIFLGTGMGSKSCAIVQQGNIGAITDASAEERRSFIEEAAGVMRYKNRKKEALAKVETTRQNLDRLHDIIDEIAQQLESLSVQAETARQYKQLQSRLKESEIRISVYYYTQYARQIESIEAKLEALSQKDADHTETLEELNARIEQMRAEAAEREAGVTEKRSQKSEKQRKLDKLESDRDYREEENARLFDELSDLETELGQLVEKNEQLEAEIAEAEENEAQLKAGIADVQSRLDEKARQSKDVREALDQAKQALEERQNRLMELSAYKAKYQNIHQNAQANKDSLKKRLKRLESDEAEALETVASLSETEAEQASRNETLNSQREELHEQIDADRQILSEKNEALGKQVKTVNTLTNERSRLRSRYSALKKMEANYEWYRDGVKAIMKHPGAAGGEDSPSAAVMGALAEFVTPEDGYELALEVCLGEALQFILVADPQAGVQSIAYLRENDAGRCGFMPQQNGGGTVEDPAAADLPTDRPYLLNHLHISKGFEPAVHALVGAAMVTEDFDEALRMRKDHPDIPIVTRQGDMIAANGAMIGGSTNKLTGIYEKKHEIRELDAKITELTERIRTEEQVQSELEGEIRSLENRLHERSTRQSELDKEINQLEKDLYKTTERLKHGRRQHEIICLEKERLEGEKEDIETEIQEHDEALEAIKQDIAEADQAVNETKARIDEHSEQLKSHDQAEVDLKLEKTRLKAELDSTRNTLSRLHRFTDESAARITDAQAAIEEKTERRDQAAQAVQTLAERIKQTRAELDELSESLKIEEQEHQALVRDLKSTDQTISKTRQTLSKNQEERHQLELELSRLKINQDNGVNRFLEQYAESFTRYIHSYQESVEAPDFSIDREEAERTECKTAIDALGEVNLGAIETYENQKRRYDFFVEQRGDLERALQDLENVIQRINRITQQLFTETFTAINEQFQELFPRLFEGGKAWLEMTQPGLPLETGIELMIQPPGKRLSRLSLLSGGEKALSAIAFIFSIFLINPASFCLLDEIDAPLDDVNIQRFNELLKIIGENSQIIMVTHNKKTMEFAEALFGVTMGDSGVSKIVTVDVERILTDTSTSAVSSNDILELQ